MGDALRSRRMYFAGQPSYMPTCCVAAAGARMVTLTPAIRNSATAKMPEDDITDQALGYHELTEPDWGRLESALDPAVARQIRSAYERVLDGTTPADLDIFELS